MEGVGLLVVDVQYDFIDGSLAVEKGSEVLEPIVALIKDVPWSLIVASQDYHPEGHVSFASNHPSGPGPFHEVKLPHPNASRAQRGETITQMLWPTHCVQGTRGANLHEDIDGAIKAKGATGTPTFTVQKGTDVHVDGYSAFADNAYLGFSALPKILFSAKPRPIDTLVVVGLATDYCVLSSAVDSAKFGLRTVVVQDAVRGVARDSSRQSWDEMRAQGIEIVPLHDGTGGSAGGTLAERVLQALSRRAR